MNTEDISIFETHIPQHQNLIGTFERVSWSFECQVLGDRVCPGRVPADWGVDKEKLPQLEACAALRSHVMILLSPSESP